ncbi:WGR domain-containing protein [Catenulispora acidiphila DSM 44928]|uniref:WGR domain-containing protein n=1 Tax=Catenulispora acidiphila (strain DSM 44928 / JCM 14897 / NBRC 102108 / NRRL B-24433 / ID139908) TaxID=479433 RepID=C7PYX8_CATAD|nr:DUF4132 domain-containing protein [Catenulispora acidiphila]ACU69534.1 WGR domain-containing protein [Catenulispora acidiphila DSM 44928]
MSGVVELPKAYQKVKPVERGRCRPDQVPAVDAAAMQQLYERRRGSVAHHQTKIDAAMRNPASDKDLVSSMKGVDFGDLSTGTPLQAAVAEAALVTVEDFGDDAAIGVWHHIRGVPFALEAFVDYCHLDSWPRVGWLQQIPVLLDRMGMARRLLDLVRAAPDDVRADTMALAERLRAEDLVGCGFARTVATFLFPERSDWLEEDLAAAGSRELPAASLIPSVATPEQAAAVGEMMRAGAKWTWDGDPAIEATFLTVAGDQALLFLLAWHDGQFTGTKRLTAARRRVLDLISRIPGDAAVRALAERDTGNPETLAYLHAAAERFPESALRVLSAMEPTPATTHVLAALNRTEPAGAAATEIQIPAILSRPPWSDPKAKRPKPLVVEGLTAPSDVSAAWLPGERERWLGRGAGWEPSQGWAAIAEQIAVWRTQPAKPDDPLTPVALYFAAYASPDLVRPLLADGWKPALRRADDRALAFVARYEVLALPAVQAIRGLPADRGRLLQPFVSADVATSMVEGMTRRCSVARGAALGWLRRHAEPAVGFLLPAALGKAGPQRRNADAALRWLAAEGTDVVGVAIAAHGEAVGVAVKELLSEGGLGTYPRSMPETPMWAMPSVLPAIRLKDGTATLPARAAQTVVEMLQISKPEAPHPGLEVVKELCDEPSLGEFAFALFENWRATGSDTSHRWAFDAMGLLGDDGTVARLEPLIGPWTTARDYALVGDALTVLGMIGGSRALAALHTVVQKGRRKPVRRRAAERFQDVAASLDLAADDLADRVVPTLGLGADGTLRLDYGPRSFGVGFDELLRPRITDESGKLLPRMPRPVKKDDEELATAAYQQFTEVKKAAQIIAVDQIKRLDKAMFTRRRWDPEGFAAHMVAHPLLCHITRRLVWGVYGSDGAPIGSFRIAEDLSYADVHDAHYEIPDGATIGVAHPVELGPAVAEWSEVFADYEILQPLDQLGRPALELTAAERASWMLERFQRVVLDANHIAALEPRGWYSGPVGDPPVWSRFLRPLGEDDRYLIVDISPGLKGGVAAGSGYQRIERVWLSVAGEQASPVLHAVPLSELDPVPASEILRDLTEVTGR